MHNRLRSFEGRTLPHQHEDLEDQGLRFDLGAVLSRRKFLSILGIGAGGVALAACASEGPGAGASTSSTTTSAAEILTEMKSETQGSYPGDGSNGPDVLDMSGLALRCARPLCHVRQ